MITVPHHISRSFIQLHPEWTFVYGFDVIGKGILGQPWAAHGEPNAYPIPTMYKFCPSGHVLFTDGRKDEWIAEIDKAVDKIPRHNPIIIFPRIGRGCSRLFELGPQTYKYLIGVLHTIQYPEIEWI